MPISQRTVTSEADQYSDPFIVSHAKESVMISIAGLTTAEVDADGYLKPGVPLKIVGGLGVLLDGTAGEYVYGVTANATKVATAPVNADTDLDDETDVEVAVVRMGHLNRDRAEDQLERAYTANEIAGFTAAGCHIAITQT